VPGGPRGLQNRRRLATVKVGSIPILSAFLCGIGILPMVRAGLAFHGLEAHATPKGGEPDVARANSQANFALVLRRVSGQVEPTGPETSFASAFNFP
jgi:hypothetical protein